MTLSNYAAAQAGSHQQRPPDRHAKSRSITGQVPARLADKAAHDFMRYYAASGDRDTRQYCAQQLQRLGVPWVSH